MDFSVVVTSYNCEEYIERCLRSILQQDGVSLEIICVDDCSRDNSSAEIKKVADSDPRVRYIFNTTNVGPASARNIGLRDAGGTNICFVDGDDMLVEGALSEIKKLMVRYNLDLLSFSGQSFTEEPQFFGSFFKDEYMLGGSYPDVLSGRGLLHRLIDNGDRVRNCVFNCIKKEYIDKHSFEFMEGLRYFDDNMFRIFINAKRILYTNKILYKRRYRHGSTMTSKKTKAHIDSFIKSYFDDVRCIESLEIEKKDQLVIEKYLNRKYIDLISFIQQIDKKEIDSFEPKGVEGYFYKYFINNTCKYEYRVSDEDAILIKNKKKVYIYGAKNNAMAMADLLNYWGINNYSFVVSDNSEIKKLLGKDVFCFADMIKAKKIDFDDSIFVIATSNRYQNEIEKLLIENGLCYCKMHYT